jgi:hypothetical protein
MVLMVRGSIGMSAFQKNHAKQKEPPITLPWGQTKRAMDHIVRDGDNGDKQ